MKLEPLRCKQCGACVPLADAAHLSCPYCRAEVPVPKPYRALLAEHALEERTRREAEQRFRALARPPRRAVDVLAVALVLLLPAVAGASAARLAHHELSIVTVFAFVVVPSLLPGTGLWLWSAAVHATIVRFHLALACAPPERDGGPPLCRNCGAALSVAPDAISASCPYCRADSLVTDIAAAARRVGDKLRDELHTLAQAILVLRLRRKLVALGALVAPLLLGALLLAAWGALRAM